MDRKKQIAMLGRDTSEDTKARIKGGGLLYPVGISTSAEFGCTSTTKLGIRKRYFLRNLKPKTLRLANSTKNPFEAALPAGALPEALPAVRVHLRLVRFLLRVHLD